jgi:predicted metal-dependent RNase
MITAGRIPILVKQGFREGNNWNNQPTRDLARIVHLDAAKLQKEEGMRDGRLRSRTWPKETNFSGREWHMNKEAIIY